MLKMKDKVKTLLLGVLFCLMAVMVIPAVSESHAAEAAHITKTSIELPKGRNYQLKVSGARSKVTWKSSAPKIAAVYSNGQVIARSEGAAVITATTGGRSYRCKVKVTGTVVQNMRQLIGVIQRKGRKNGNGEPTLNLTYKDNTYAIVYKGGNSLYLVYRFRKAGSDTVYIDMTYNGTSTVTVRFIKGMRRWTKKVKVTSIRYKTKIGFNTGLAQYNTIGENALQNAMLGWDSVIRSAINMKISSIGFTSYHGKS